MTRISLFPFWLALLLILWIGSSDRSAAAEPESPRPESAAILTASPDWYFDGDQDGALMGYSVSAAGDVNGDEFADVIVGSPLFTRSDGVYREGAAFVFFGAPQGLTSTPAWAMGSAQQGSAFGTSVAAAGDVNGDGFADVIVGAPDYKVAFGLPGEPKSGAVFVYHGSETGPSLVPDWMVLAEAPEIRLGEAVAGVGDVNGDDYDDVIIGAPWFSGGQTNEGKAYLYLGSASGLEQTPAWVYESNVSNASFGKVVQGGADINADGFAEVIVGAPYYKNPFDNEGAAFVFFGNDEDGLSKYANWIGFGRQAGALFGSAVALGDVNGDGFADALVGAPGYDVAISDDNRGVVYAYFGRADDKLLADEPNWQMAGPQVGAGFGKSLSAAGDANGDGIADLLVGAYLFGESGTIEDRPDEGAAFLFAGQNLTISSTASWDASGGKAEAWFGYSVSFAGDLNDDDRSDLLVGAPTYRFDEKTVMGRAFAFLSVLEAGEGTSVYLPLVTVATEQK